MVNLSNMEKLLRHNLKRNVKVTLATVVMFLITGVVSYGQNISEEIKDEKTSTIEKQDFINISITDTGKIKVETDRLARGIVLNKGGAITNNGEIDVQKIKNDDNQRAVGIESFGKLEVTNNKLISVAANNTQANGTGVFIRNNVDTDIINNENGKITIGHSRDAEGIKAEHRENTAGRLKVHNKGEILVSNEQGNNGFGIKADGKADNYLNIDLNNEKKIEVKSPNAYGIYTRYISGNMENSGDIIVNGTSAYGIYSRDLKGKNDFINKGSINVTSTTGPSYGINIRNIDGENNVINEGKITSIGNIAYGIFGMELTGKNKFINKGTVDVTTKTSLASGIGLQVKDSSLTDGEYVFENSGTISSKLEGQNNGMMSAVEIVNKGDKDISAINHKTGILETVGKNKNGAVVKLSAEKAGKINFINEGTIRVKDGGIGISSTGSRVSALNKGQIELSGESIAIKTFGSKVENAGTVKINDKALDEITKEDIYKIFDGNIENTGMIVDKNDTALKNDNTAYLTGDISTDQINIEGKNTSSVTLGQKSGTNILGGNSPADIKSLNIVGRVRVKNSVTTKANPVLAVGNLNLDSNGKLDILSGNSLVIDGSHVIKNGTDKESFILGKDSKLELKNAVINGADITGQGNISTQGNTTINANVTSLSLDISGNSQVNGNISTNTININGKDKSNLVLLSTSKFLGNTQVNSQDGTIVFDIGSKGENALASSSGKVTINGNIDFNTEELTDNVVVELNNKVGQIHHDLNNVIYKDKLDGVYQTSLDKINNILSFTYNKNLYNLPELNSVNNAMQVINNMITQDITAREKLIDKIYSSNIYSETVKAAYDNVKLNEEAVESLARKSKIGKWTAEGKVLYSKNEYDRKGIVGDYSSEIESTGLMAAYGYGLNETTTAGMAFSGVKQDVDTATGSADADLFYLGVYGNKAVGNYDFTAGLGYQFGKYEADNNILAGTGDKYDSQTVSGYVQGRYTADLGDGLSVQPKVKLGYTYVKQDDAKDSYFGVEDAEISTFDAEAGFDVVKSVQLEKSKVDVKFGASYIRTMGDTDEEFTGRFYGAKASEGFNVLGAELAENVVKFNLGAEVMNENGFFYNGGFTHEFGSNDTKVYGISVGVGYIF